MITESKKHAIAIIIVLSITIASFLSFNMSAFDVDNNDGATRGIVPEIATVSIL